MANLFIQRNEDGSEEEVEVADEDLQAAEAEPSLERGDAFIGPDGAEVVVPISSFENAIAAGLKPKRENPGAWEAFKTGAAKSLATVPQSMGWSVGKEPWETSVEEELAYQQETPAYVGGRIAGMVPLAAAAVGTGIAAIKGGQKAAPHVAPVGRAFVEGAKNSEKNMIRAAIVGGGFGAQSGDLKEVAGTAIALGGLGAIAGGAAEAGRQISTQRQYQREMKEIEQGKAPVTPPMRPPEAPFTGFEGQGAEPPVKVPMRPPEAVPGPTEERVPLDFGLNILRGGEGPEKDWWAEKSATMLPGGVQAEDLKRISRWTPTERQEARRFQKDEAAAELFPDLLRTKKNLRKDRSKAFRELQDRAAQNYKGGGATKAIQTLADETFEISRPELKHSAAAKEAVGLINSAIHEGIAPKENKFSEGVLFHDASPQEQYYRMQYAREMADEIRTALGTSSDKKTSRQTLNVLDKIRVSLDEELKTEFLKRQADEMYGELKQAGKLFKSSEVGKGRQAESTRPALAKTYGVADKAKYAREYIETMAKVLAKHGDKLPHAEEMRAFVQKYAQQQTVAERQRLLQLVEKYQSGPTGNEVTRMSALQGQRGMWSELFTNPGAAVAAFDQFVTMKAKEQNQVFEQMPKDVQRKFVQMLVWRKNNMNATQDQEKKAFDKIMKGK